MHVPIPNSEHDPCLQPSEWSLKYFQGESAGQLQIVSGLHTVLPMPVVVHPDEHGLHAVEPVSSLYIPSAATPLYFPARHIVQVPPLGPSHPALQVQAAKAKLPAGEYELGGHCMHVVELAVQVPTNPAFVWLLSDVKTTFRYGWLVVDVKELVSLPESIAICVFVLHDNDVH